MHFLLGVEEAIKCLNEYFDYVFAVTNQGGIGLGYMKEKQLNKIHDYMVAELEKKGAMIHEVAYFPTEQQVMLNFQVHDLNELIQHLEQLGISLEKEKEMSEFGTFIRIKDPEGRLVELWEK